MTLMASTFIVARLIHTETPEIQGRVTGDGRIHGTLAPDANEDTLEWV